MGPSSSWKRWRCLSALALWLVAAAAFAEAPRIEAIFPSGALLPANHLKFYLHFSAPMREGIFLDYCRLLDEHGAPVADPFRETELWSEDHRRLTLWLHPGRQKTGVNLNDDFGPVLQPGHAYTLVIAAGWPSADGVPLGGEVRKAFRTSERSTAQLDAGRWQIAAPKAGSLEPVEIHFPAPLDHALLQRCLHVLDETSASVEGSVATADDERTWRFTPAHAWRVAGYQIQAESILEDLAGNSLARPFEVDLSAPPPKAVPRVVCLPFQPRAH